MFDFSKLRITINEIWEFIFPPIVNVGIISLIYLVIRTDLSIFKLNNLGSTLLFIKSPQIQEFLDAYKISNLIPVISLILIVFLLNMVNKTIYAIGSLLPIRVTYNITNLYTGAWNFMKLWEFYPKISDPNQLIRIVETSCEEEKIKKSSTGDILISFAKRKSKIWEKIAFIKFLVFLLLFFFLSNIFSSEKIYKNPLILLALFLTSLFLLYYFIQQVALIRQEAEYKIESLYSVKLSQDNKSEAEIEQPAQSRKIWSEQKGWWWIHLGYHFPYWLGFFKQYQKTSRQAIRKKRR